MKLEDVTGTFVGPFEYRLDLYEYLAATRRRSSRRRKDRRGARHSRRTEGRFGTSGANSSLPGAFAATSCRRSSASIAGAAAPTSRRRDPPHREIGLRRRLRCGADQQLRGGALDHLRCAVDAAADGARRALSSALNRIDRAACRTSFELRAPVSAEVQGSVRRPRCHCGRARSRGRRNQNTDIVMVPMAGASYTLHGIKFYPCPLLMNTDADATTGALRRAANIHAATSAVSFRSATIPPDTATARKA